MGPLKGIVTPTTIYQYLQLVSMSIMTMSLCGAVPRGRFLFIFPTQKSKEKYIIIFDRPLMGPLKGIVTPTTIYQYLQLVSMSIMTLSLCGAVPRDIDFCLFSYPRDKSEIYHNFDRPQTWTP